MSELSIPSKLLLLIGVLAAVVSVSGDNPDRFQYVSNWKGTITYTIHATNDYYGADGNLYHGEVNYSITNDPSRFFKVIGVRQWVSPLIMSNATVKYSIGPYSGTLYYPALEYATLTFTNGVSACAEGGYTLSLPRITLKTEVHHQDGTSSIDDDCADLLPRGIPLGCFPFPNEGYRLSGSVRIPFGSFRPYYYCEPSWADFPWDDSDFVTVIWDLEPEVLPVLPCEPLPVISVAPRHVEFAGWSMDLEISEEEGVVLKNVSLTGRLMAEEMSLPYLYVETTTFPKQRLKLRRDGNDEGTVTRLIDFDIHTDFLNVRHLQYWSNLFASYPTL
jgi:hypothetical protein